MNKIGHVRGTANFTPTMSHVHRNGYQRWGDEILHFHGNAIIPCQKQNTRLLSFYLAPMVIYN